MIYCYALMHDALNELCQVVNKDNILIHMQNRLYAMEDTLYQYISNPQKEGTTWEAYSKSSTR